MAKRVELSGALTLVTGAGSGIGRATAAALARAGAHVLAVDIDELTVKTTAALCADLGAQAQAYACDVADRAAVQALADQVGLEHGALDVLVNNAGVGMTGTFVDMSVDDWEWIRSINLDGVVHGCHAFGPAMLAQGRGHVVNISSGLAYAPRSTEVAYCTTKAAVLMFSRSLRADWRRHGVGVSAVCPGVINTPILERARFVGEMSSPLVIAAAKRGFRFGHRPEVVADAVLTAVRRNRAVVPAGIEARIGWQLVKVLPVPVADQFARSVPRVITRAIP
ncbi:MAG: SDR family NAD(P)-dependent oxidoreductase [Acidimicrobiales bacterium]